MLHAKGAVLARALQANEAVDRPTQGVRAGVGRYHAHQGYVRNGGGTHES